MKITERLRRHRADRRFFRQLLDAENVSARRESMARLVAWLTALDGLREHHMLQVILEVLDEIDLEDNLFHARMALLADVVGQHMDEVEGAA